jgi:two-component sensor histidine kinase
MESRSSVLAEVRDGLAWALIASSNAPILLLDGALVVIAASASFCAAFRIDPAAAPGQPLAALGGGEWDLPELARVLRATAEGGEILAYEMDLAQPERISRRLVINAHKLDYADGGDVRLILSATDVTEARINAKLKDDLLHEKSILLQELEHRIANSLQIIASVLMQSARKVRSEQARGHLRDARNRVMSIATMQRQLAASRLGDVVLRAYFTELCDSIGASMIHDRDQLSLSVTADGSMAKGNVSVSLGLIVTELVINALKHGFPHHRKGRILVDYRSDGPAWVLSVRDTGVGMTAEKGPRTPGLGTGIVDALARHLGASVQIADAQPGAMVSIVHA